MIQFLSEPILLFLGNLISVGMFVIALTAVKAAKKSNEIAKQKLSDSENEMCVKHETELGIINNELKTMNENNKTIHELDKRTSQVERDIKSLFGILNNHNEQNVKQYEKIEKKVDGMNNLLIQIKTKIEA